MKRSTNFHQKMRLYVGVVALVALGAVSTAYGSVLHSIGIARNGNSVDASVSYIEHHQYLESGQHLIRYYDNELQLLLTKELRYPRLPQHPTLKQRDLVADTEIFIETEESAAVMSERPMTKGNAFEFELTEDIIIDAGFDAYVRSNWRSFDAQPVRQFRFAVAGQPRLLEMEIRRVSANGEGASFTITPRNWFVRLLLPTTSLDYDATGQLVRYEGFSNLKRSNEGRNVEINFKHYRMDTSLSMPLNEWLPASLSL